MSHGLPPRWTGITARVRAVTRPLHVGRTVITVQTDLSDGAGRRVAQVTQVQAVLGGDGGR